MYFRKVLILNLFISTIMSQEQLGSDIDGEAANDNSGRSDYASILSSSSLYNFHLFLV